MRARHQGKLKLQLLLPVLHIGQAALFISQFSAVSVLAKEKVSRQLLAGAAVQLLSCSSHGSCCFSKV